MEPTLHTAVHYGPMQQVASAIAWNVQNMSHFPHLATHLIRQMIPKCENPIRHRVVLICARVSTQICRLVMIKFRPSARADCWQRQGEIRCRRAKPEAIFAFADVRVYI